MLKKRWVRITLIVVLALVPVTAVFWGVLFGISAEQNKTIHVSHYTVSHEQIPAAFDGKRIVQLSDLHNKDFGDSLTQLVKEQEPDIIVITGDWIGRYDTDISVARAQLEALVGIAPLYYVAGNHEAVSPLYDELYEALIANGVTVLAEGTVDWTIGDESVQLIGLNDPEFSTHLWRDMAPYVDEERYSILLFHRPEYFEEAVSYGADLILAGHTHGGQIRLPLIGAVFAPNQDWFPQYDVGRFDSGESTMIISEGLGESAYVRILTPPELVVVTLKTT